MSLLTGSRIGSYEILSAIGKGGMGEVYRARDTSLDRSVAIKALPKEFETDPDRLARFEREAKVLASLNHKNIGAIYGLEKHDGRHFLVLELIEGETLADQIARGPIPVEDALNLAVQIADALQAAHEKGVIHRDLKPANIKITPDGTAKVLDFGLAKSGDAEAADRDNLSNSPTLGTLTSAPGMILGTAAYMSPEQAKGRPVDRRTDIFAFGCVFYEMLTGKRAFEGEDVSDTLAAVLRAEPDWTALPAEIPAALRTLIQRCVAKDRSKRVAEISSVKFVLSEPHFFGHSSDHRIGLTSPPPRSKTRLWIAAGLILTAVLAGALGWSLRPQASPPSVVRFSTGVPPDPAFLRSRAGMIAVSPDGTQIVFAANSRLYRQSLLSDFEAKPIPGSEAKELTPIGNPTFSPDGQWIAYLSEQTIKRIAVNGGTPIEVAPSAAARGSMSWTREGLVFAQPSQAGSRIFRVSPSGGMPEPIVTLKDEGAFEPQLLPGGHSVLFTATKGVGDDRWDEAKVVVQSLTSGERKPLVDGSGGRYLSTGHLVYAEGGTLFAVPFDVKQERVVGEPVPVLEGIRRRAATGGAQVSVSDTGTLIFVPGPSTFSGRARMLIITDRTGSTKPLPLPPEPYLHPRVSRNGKQAAVAIDNGNDAFVSIYEFSAATALRRLTFEGHNRFPVWSGDSQWVAFQSDREGDLGIYMQRANGSSKAERLTKAEPGTEHVPESWSPNGKTLLFSEKKDARFSLLMLSLDSKNVARFGNVESRNPIGATFSPDGSWVAYSTVRGTGGARNTGNGVYVEPFPTTGATRYQVPKEYFDFHPVWGSSIAELFYIPTASRLSVIPIQTRPNFTFGKAVSLRPVTADRINTDVRDYDVLPDGGFLSSVPASDGSVSGSDEAPQIRVVLNWFEELRQRVPVK